MIHGAYGYYAQMCPKCEILFNSPEYFVIQTPPLHLTIERMNDNAILPVKAHYGDLGYDLFASDPCRIEAGDIRIIPTGIRIHFPVGYGAKMFDRSSVATKKKCIVVAGVLDNGYRGEIKIALHNTTSFPVNIEQGEKIAQMVPVKVEDFQIRESVVDVDTSRGEGGFGSSNAT
jgi:dUTP pyrophosphatase